jgi:SAM-dependent methyltransferase
MNKKLLIKFKNNYERLAKENIEKDKLSLTYKQEQSLKLKRYLPPLSEKVIFDLGCGKGLFLDFVRDCKFKFGGDISLIYCEYTKNKSIPAVCLTAEKLPFKKKSLDVIVATDILEHVLDLTSTVRSIHIALKKNGLFLLRVPYKENISKYKKERGFKYDFGHLRSFNEEKLQEVLEGLFKIKSYQYDGFVYYGTRLKGIFQKIFHKSVGKIIDLLYDHRWEIMPNWLGNIVCKPVEIVVLAEKIQ